MLSPAVLDDLAWLRARGYLVVRTACHRHPWRVLDHDGNVIPVLIAGRIRYSAATVRDLRAGLEKAPVSHGP